jgi:hypothetical protein
MKNFLLTALAFCCSTIAKATLYLVVVAQSPPLLINMCPGDTVRFAGDSLNQNVYGTVSCIIQNMDSSLNSFCAVSSFTNVATTCDHILAAGDIGYAFAPNILGSGLFSFNCLTSIRTEEKEISRIYVYPNPVTDKLEIISGENQPASIIIYDQAGRIMIERQSFLQKETIDVSDLKEGAYIMEIGFATGRKCFSRFVKL